MGGTAPLTGKPGDLEIVHNQVKELKCDLAETTATLKQFISDWHQSRLEAIQRQSDLAHGIVIAQNKADSATGRIDKVEPKIAILEKLEPRVIILENNQVRVVDELSKVTKLVEKFGQTNNVLKWILGIFTAVVTAGMVTLTIKLIFP